MGRNERILICEGHGIDSFRSIVQVLVIDCPAGARADERQFSSSSGRPDQAVLVSQRNSWFIAIADHEGAGNRPDA